MEAASSNIASFGTIGTCAMIIIVYTRVQWVCALIYMAKLRQQVILI